MKLTALTGIFFYSYPVLLFLRVQIFSVPYPAYDLFYVYLAMIIGSLVFIGLKEGKIPTNRSMFAIALAAILFLFSYIYYQPEGVFRAVLEGISLFIFYYIGTNTAFMPFHQVLSSKRIFYGTVLIGGVLLAAYYLPAFETVRRLVIISAYIFMIAAFIVKNQKNLDRFILKDMDISQIPKYIRSWNAGFIIILSAIVLMIFNLKYFVALIINFLGSGIKRIISLVFDSGDYVSPGSGPIEEIPEAELPEIDLDIGAGTDPRIMMIIAFLSFLFAVAVFFVIIENSKNLPAALRQFVQTVKEKIVRIISFIKSFFRIYSQTENNDEFIDEIEIVVPDKEKEGAGGWRELFNWRGFRKVRDPVSRIRAIYKTVLRRLMTLDIRIRKSDTVWQIHRKTIGMKGIDPSLTDLSKTYDRVRYGEYVPDPDELDHAEDLLEQLENSVKQLRRTMVKRNNTNLHN